MNMNKKWWMIIVLVLFVVLNTACNSIDSGSSINLEEQLDGSTINHISIHSTAKVHFEKSKDDNVHVKLNGTFSGSKEEEDELISTSLNGSELTIKVENTGSRLWKVNQLQLDIQVPDKTYEKVVIETSSGDIKIMDDFTVNVLDLEASSGDIEVASFAGSEFHIKTSSGDINAKHLMGKGDVKASSGDVQISIDDFSESISVETSSGDANVYVPEDAAFHIEAQTKWEKATINLPVTMVKNESQNSVIGKVNNPETGPTLHIKTSSGQFLLDGV